MEPDRNVSNMKKKILALSQTLFCILDEKDICSYKEAD